MGNLNISSGGCSTITCGDAAPAASTARISTITALMGLRHEHLQGTGPDDGTGIRGKSRKDVLPRGDCRTGPEWSDHALGTDTLRQIPTESELHMGEIALLAIVAVVMSFWGWLVIRPTCRPCQMGRLYCVATCPPVTREMSKSLVKAPESRRVDLATVPSVNDALVFIDSVQHLHCEPLSYACFVGDDQVIVYKVVDGE